MEDIIAPPGWQSAWPEVSLQAPTGYDREWVAQFPLSTKGRHILDARGHRFRLKGVNWYGASDVNHVVGGLDTQWLETICHTVATLGFNVVRLPFSNEMLRSEVPKGTIDYSKNPELEGLSALQVYDAVVCALGRHKVAVIVNNHTTYGEFCGPPSKNSLWFDPSGPFSEAQWHADWRMVATRFKAYPHVVGFDLRNEIRPRWSLWPRFGYGGSSGLWGRRDWAHAAQAAARELLAIRPSALIVVERIVWPQQPLDAYASTPGPLLPELEGRLVLGVHAYSWSGPGRFLPGWSVPTCLVPVVGLLKLAGVISRRNYGEMEASYLSRQAYAEWGAVLAAETCPVWVSEFGADLNNPLEMRWLQAFIDILAASDADWAYWPLNVGPKPACGCDEAYGMLSPDWTPSQYIDFRLKMMEAIGLPAQDAHTPRPASPGVPLTEREIDKRSRTLMASKDPLLGLKHAPLLPTASIGLGAVQLGKGVSALKESGKRLASTPELASLLSTAVRAPLFSVASSPADLRSSACTQQLSKGQSS